MAKRFRHDCPECKKEGRRRYLTCRVVGFIGAEKHYVECPDHGWKEADYPKKKEVPE